MTDVGKAGHPQDTPATLDAVKGSMHERRPGVWRLRVYVGTDPVTGQKRHASRTFNGTKRQAETALSKFVSDVSKGAHGGPTSVTLAGLLDAYCKHAEGVGRSPTTVAEYRRQTEHLRNGVGRVQLSKLRPRQLDELYATLGARGFPGGKGPLSSASVRRYHALLSAALRQALKWGWIETSPAMRATSPKEAKPLTSSPTPAELHKLIEGAAAIQPAHGVLIALAAMTGARRGELAALRWSDVDLASGVVHLRRSLKQVGTVVTEGDTKTHQERAVALPIEAVDVLRRHRRDIETAAEKRGLSLASDPFVFSPTTDHAKPYVPTSISQMFYKVARDAGMAYHLHQLRHFAATQAIAAGFDAVTVAARLGHADPSVTLRVYAHAIESKDREAAEALGAIVVPPKGSNRPRKAVR